MRRPRRSKENLNQKSQPSSEVSKATTTPVGSPSAARDEKDLAVQASSEIHRSTQHQSSPTKTAKDGGGRTLKDDGNNSSDSSPNSENIDPSIFGRIISVIRVIRIELLFGLLALILSLGQYFQSGIAIRINITSIWREGYTSEIRDRVSKFRHLYHNKWTAGCQDSRCTARADETVRKLVSTKRLLSEDIQGDEYIRELVSDEIALLKYERKPANGEYTPTNEDYVQAALKYRNAIIECLNTAEAVKAVIEARPLPFRRHLLYSDTLEGRYRDIISELKDDLMIFIKSYRDITKGRETEAWFVLTSVESHRIDYIVAGVLILVLILILTVVYFVKVKYRRSGGGIPSQPDMPDTFITRPPD